jgi:C4-dicarboxylate-specific signal transduction histidine kinase
MKRTRESLQEELQARQRGAEALRAAHAELERTNAELRQLTLELEDRVAQRAAELEAKSAEVHQMSQQLWQAAKLATMGELAASIAHELNNPLATISLRVESLLVHSPADDPKRHALTVVEQEAERMAI